MLINSRIRSALATPNCTWLKEKMEINVGKRNVPIKPMKVITWPRLMLPPRQSSSACKKPPAQARLNINIGR